MKYKVAVAESSRRVVAVEARTEREAYVRVRDAWANGEIALDERDFEGAEFVVLGAVSGEKLDRVDGKWEYIPKEEK